jgi:hypothetical protein
MDLQNVFNKGIWYLNSGIVHANKEFDCAANSALSSYRASVNSWATIKQR